MESARRNGRLARALPGGQHLITYFKQDCFVTVPLVAGREPSVSLCVGLSFPEGMSALSAPVLTLRDYKFKPTPPPQTKAPRGSALEDRMKAKETLGSQGAFTQREYRGHLNVPRATIPTETTPPPAPGQSSLH